MRRTLMILILALPLTAGAEPLFMKDSLKGREFFDPWGVGVDVFTMKQDYQLKKLEFDLPGVAPIDPEDVDVTNEINHYRLHHHPGSYHFQRLHLYYNGIQSGADHPVRKTGR